MKKQRITFFFLLMVNFSICGNSKDNPIYPASYDTVISVTSVGTEDVGFTSNGIQLEWRDRVENLIGNSNSTHHLNNLVDISAPGYAIPVLTNNYQGIKYNDQFFKIKWPFKPKIINARDKNYPNFKPIK